MNFMSKPLGRRYRDRPYMRRRNLASRALVKLAARGAGRAFARITLIGLLGPFGVEASLFAAAYPAMGPQPFQDHFGGSRGGPGILAIFNAESVDVFHQAL